MIRSAEHRPTTRVLQYLSLLLPLVFLCLPWNISLGQDSPSGTTPESAVSEETLSAGESEISQEQLRQALIELIEGPPRALTGTETANQDWEIRRAGEFGDILEQTIAAIPSIPAEIAASLALATNPEMGWGAWRIILTLAVVILVGLALEHIATRKMLARLNTYAGEQDKNATLRIRYAIARVFIQLVGVLVLGVVTFGLSLFLSKHNSYLEGLVNITLLALVQFRLWLILLQNLFHPSRPELRLVPVDDALARDLFTWFTVFFVIIEFGGGLNQYMYLGGSDPAVLDAALLIYTLGLNLVLLTRIWVNRQQIGALFVEDRESGPSSFAGAFMLQAWPFLLTAWLVLLWMTWLYKVFLGEFDDARYVTYSWWVTIAFPVADRLFHRLLKHFVNVRWLQSPTFETRSQRFLRVAQIALRVVLFSIALYLLSEAGGFRTGIMIEDTLAQKVLGHAIDVLVILVIAYMLWELLYAFIERKFPPEEEPDAIASLEGDGGGAGASRAETLLPLIRSFLSVVIVTFAVLSVLHSLGIAIGPIIAGAGVIGIAIGFGAQKLVQDVLSGVFFLLDDAFRKGEYIELQGLKGTVEKISLRSMQLRHHLGAVQTVPYGEIQTVKNLSRDWVTMKLELRLDYETDIEKVRKIIKKVGQEMLLDEEMGPSFILPLKSQGVMRVEESALIVRMKFTAKPGEQWVIRREAYRRVRDALADAGIHFAHREVRVRLPGEDAAGTPPPTPPAEGAEPAAAADPEQEKKELIAEAAAAAASSVIASEALKKGKMDDMDDEM